MEEGRCAGLGSGPRRFQAGGGTWSRFCRARVCTSASARWSPEARGRRVESEGYGEGNRRRKCQSSWPRLSASLSPVEVPPPPPPPLCFPARTGDPKDAVKGLLLAFQTHIAFPTQDPDQGQIFGNARSVAHVDTDAATERRQGTWHVFLVQNCFSRTSRASKHMFRNTAAPSQHRPLHHRSTVPSIHCTTRPQVTAVVLGQSGGPSASVRGIADCIRWSSGRKDGKTRHLATALWGKLDRG